jgi:TP901 family phage tail tape measure protein
MSRAEKQTLALSDSMLSISKFGAVAFAANSAVILKSLNDYKKFEKGLVAVGKTANIEGKKLEKFGNDILEMTETLPSSAEKMLEVAAAAGQLGVQGEENIKAFTETLIRLESATDIVGEEGAKSIARVLEVTKDGVGFVEKFGSVITALGNNSAASEAEILKVTNSVALATAQFKIGSVNAAAFGAAMKSSGIEAQLGGSVIGKLFREIETATRNGGNTLREFARISGQTTQEFSRNFREDATQAVLAFLGGLKDTESVSGSLEKVGLKGDEVNKVIPTLAVNFDGLTKAMSLANKEARTNQALFNESEKAFSTLESQTQVLVNGLRALSIKVGAELAPDIKNLLGSITGLVGEFNNLDKETIANVASFIKWGAIVSASVTGVGLLSVALLKARVLIIALARSFSIAKVSAAGFLGVATGGLSIVLGFLPEIIEYTKKLFSYFNKDEEPKNLIQVKNKLDELIEKRATLKELESDGGDPTVELRIKAINEEIEALEKLKKAKEDAAGNVDIESTLGLEKDPVNFSSPENAKLSSTEPEQEIDPINKSLPIDDGRNPDSNTEPSDSSQSDDDLKETIRKEKIKSELEEIKQLRQGAALEEIEFDKSMRELNIAELEAGLIKEDEIREVELEKINEKRAQLKEQRDQDKADKVAEGEEEKQRLTDQLNGLNEIEQEFAARKRALEDEEKEAKGIRDDDLRNLELDKIKLKNKVLLNEQDEYLKKKTAREKKEQSILGKYNKLIQNEEVSGALQTRDRLVALQNSKNKTLKGIGKAAAITKIAQETAVGAISAYTSMSGIPIIGPALGAAAAAALVAYGAERISNVKAANRGAFVSGGISGVDTEPFLLSKNEVVTPEQNYEEHIQSVISQRGYVKQDGSEEESVESSVARVELSFDDDYATEMFRQNRVEQEALGIA